MSTPDASGPAFPLQTVFDHRLGELVQAGSQGMTLRQWYAGLAMQTMLTVCQQDTYGSDYLAHCAKNSFRMADALIKESNK